MLWRASFVYFSLPYHILVVAGHSSDSYRNCKSRPVMMFFFLKWNVFTAARILLSCNSSYNSFSYEETRWFAKEVGVNSLAVCFVNL